MNKNVPAFIGRCPTCDGVILAAVDNGRQEIAVEVAEAIRRGYRVEHVTVGYVREVMRSSHWCSCNDDERVEQPAIEQPALFTE